MLVYGGGRRLLRPPRARCRARRHRRADRRGWADWTAARDRGAAGHRQDVVDRRGEAAGAGPRDGGARRARPGTRARVRLRRRPAALRAVPRPTTSRGARSCLPARRRSRSRSSSPPCWRANVRQTCRWHCFTACTGSRRTWPAAARPCSPSTTCTGATCPRSAGLAYLLPRMEGLNMMVLPGLRAGRGAKIQPSSLTSSPTPASVLRLVPLSAAGVARFVSEALACALDRRIYLRLSPGGGAAPSKAARARIQSPPSTSPQQRRTSPPARARRAGRSTCRVARSLALSAEATRLAQAWRSSATTPIPATRRARGPGRASGLHAADDLAWS